ncbi:SGNH/GDSL hydrolase family protein [Streptomyces sp. ISL-111]|uniref:SGNH/GDSL hydrolase family protein n=1 Tax=unclassified Streptomyces TaxID=2593676 RepID=UPI001BE7C764|nr:SGNH/GDSL hydrolase family protein [Streptomyces sp. ISL-111]MBT2381929.1 SGNH/GDSL hydrolase family protein [Streptomyces sp. ISL-111]
MNLSLRTTLAAAVAATAMATTLAAPAAAESAEPLDYVALGDSFAAAPLVLPVDTSNLLCLRSLADYPHVAAKALGARLTDASCSGATAEHLTTSQYLGTKPQLKALSEDTDVVSITIGGNDTGLVTAALGCLNVLPKPRGSSCAARNTKDGVDSVKAGIDAWAPKFATALNQIKQRAPHAKVFVIGYGNYIRPGGCFPTQPIWDVDATYIQGATDHLSAALRTTARQHGATFVDTYSLGIGHDVCAAPADRYIEGIIPAHIATPLHPNAKGSEAIGSALASSVLSAIRTG